MNGVDIAGEYPTKHMDMLNEMDHVVGSLVSMIEEKGLGTFRFQIKIIRLV